MNQIKKGALLSYINIFLTNTIGLILTPFIVKSLGDSEYGLYTLIGAFVGYIAIMDLGLNNTIVRYVSKYRALEDKESEENFLGTSFIIYGVISFFVVIVGSIFYFNLENIFSSSLNPEEIKKAKLMTLILIFNLAITLPGGAFTAISNAYEKFVFPRALANIKYILRSILVILILYLGADSIGLVILDTFINVLTIIATFIYIKKYIKVKFKFQFPQKTMLYEIFSYSVWIFIFAIIGQIQWKGGQFIIGTNLGTKEVAVYAIGILLGSYYGAFSGALSNLFLPRATQMVVHSATNIQLTHSLIKIGRYSLFSLLLIFIGFVALGKEFIILWVGETYLDAYYIAIIIMVGYTIPLSQTFANSLLEAKKLFKFKTLVYFTSLFIGTLISFYYVKKNGIIGVISCIVISWLISQIVMNIFYIKILKLDIKQFFIKSLKDFIPPLISTSIASLFIIYIPIDGWIGLTVKGILIVISYILSLIFLTMNEEEKQILNKILKTKNGIKIK
ncbi:oligosaccharide flippase family protein [Faecalibacter rhinopitheci]|uniref:Oligosaccharide flippase family protein n=1 Tax=Faecalibacter rhinopitheci TaxID=2779678 RepID=A0A8J7FR66_9FLAO|nr:oligosaccharide flippase family protein [Faecalibacter rhinopitheci]MBF0598349.1 oligosaccharide flippase family protein [Faecalibacter rhinopitheci]